MIEGKIYILKSKNTNKVYIGSTTMRLKRRLKGHKTAFKKFLNSNGTYCTSFDILECGDYYIELLREVAVEDKQKLRSLEGETITLYRNQGYNVVNKNIAGRTQKEYGKQYRVENAQKIKQYYEDNKVELQIKKQEKHICDKCGGSYTHNHIIEHNKTKKHLSFII